MSFLETSDGLEKTPTEAHDRGVARDKMLFRPIPITANGRGYRDILDLDARKSRPIGRHTLAVLAESISPIQVYIARGPIVKRAIETVEAPLLFPVYRSFFAVDHDIGRG